MAETITPNQEEHTAVEEMYNQAVNNNALNTEEKATLEEFAQEVGTTVDALAEARKSREQEAQQRLANTATQHYLDTDANAEHWVKPKD